MDSSVLQEVVDVMRAAVEPMLKNRGALDTSPRTVTFTNGKSVDYPAWLLEHRGHDLVPVYQSVFGGPANRQPAAARTQLAKRATYPY